MNTVTQCDSCPWRVSCDPERDIPNGYSVELHENLRDTITSGIDSLGPARALEQMARAGRRSTRAILRLWGPRA